MFELMLMKSDVKAMVLFVSGKSFLRNRLFRGLDSWPSSSFCVSLLSYFVLQDKHKTSLSFKLMFEEAFLYLMHS